MRNPKTKFGTVCGESERERERGGRKRELERERFQTMSWIFFEIDGVILIFQVPLNNGQLTVSSETEQTGDMY